MYRLLSRAFLVLIFSATSLLAQFIIEQTESEIPVSYALIPEDAEFDGPEDEAKFMLNISENKLKEAALAEGREIREEKVTIYISGESFAVETHSKEMGKVTLVSNTKNGTIYNIMWAQKRVFKMTPEDMEKMKEEARVETEKMLKNLSPEMRKQIKAEMDKEKNKPSEKYFAQASGKKMKISGFNCEEYKITKNEDIITVWAAKDDMGLVKKADYVSKKFDELFMTDDNEDFDEWQIVPGKIPVQVRRYSSSMMMDEPAITIQTIIKIEKKKPSAEKFKIPGQSEGFTQGSMMDMMMLYKQEEEY